MAENYWLANGTIIAAEDILKVATRDIPSATANKVEHDRLMSVFAWYWDHYLPAVGGSVYWRQSVRRTKCISTAMLMGVLCIPKSTEAFAVLIYENCEQKWPNIFALQKKDGKQAAVIPRKKDDDASKDFVGPYISARGGQAPFGGFTKAGKLRFNELCEQVGRGRQLGSSSHLEEECLGDVRVAAKLDRELPDPNAPRPKKRRRRSAADDETEDEEDVDCYDDED